MKHSFRIAAFVVCLFASSNVAAQSPLKVTYKHAPMPVVIEGKTMLYYELHLFNPTPDTIKILSINLFDGNSEIDRVVETRLMNAFMLRTGKRANDAVLIPDASAILYFETEITRFALPALFPITRFQVSNRKPESFAGILEITQQKPVVLGPPLKSGNWAAVYSPDWIRGHRRVLFETDGKERIPGRFAIDFIKLDDNGKYSAGDEDVIANWYGYNADVIAVADGIVSAAEDDFKESKTIKKHPSYPAEKATGNFITIDIGEEQYAFYEHLKPGSIKVRVGQKVKKGDVIASLGFTGQSTGPHLHFHLANANSPLGAEGIPFVFERFEVLGSYPDFSRFGKDQWTPSGSENNVITNERPGPNTVIRF
jgi:murein DD-endopeptidase